MSDWRDRGSPQRRNPAVAVLMILLGLPLLLPGVCSFFFASHAKLMEAGR